MGARLRAPLLLLSCRASSAPSPARRWWARALRAPLLLLPCQPSSAPSPARRWWARALRAPLLLLPCRPSSAPSPARRWWARALRAPLLLLPILAPALAQAAGSGSPTASDAGASLAALVERARADRLAEDPAWLRLGHWRRRLLGGFESEVDGPAFFRAPGGKTDPAAELEATLAGFLGEPPEGDELDDAVCRFPARLLFLSRRLGLDPARLPPRSCPRLGDFLGRVAPRGVTLVFSSYYLENPSSAFGHTLLRLDRAEGALGGEHFELLDYGVNYAATVDTSNAVLYAVKGLFGLFKGEFTHQAYYYKVRAYSEAESRDLWEYDLALAPDEVEMLALHLWELGGTWFDYWYLDENCSYHVLGALEAAAPRLDLLSHVSRLVVLPVDTVRALFRNPGLVRAVHYRPSIRSQFRARAAPLSRADAGAVAALAADPAAPLPAGGAGGAALLDAAVDLVDLRHFRELVTGKDPGAAALRQRLLERRSAIDVASPPLEVPVPAHRAPHLGHRSGRAGAGGGLSREEGPFLAIDLRLALHDLADPPEGHPELSRIEFLPARLRLFTEGGRVEVDEVHLVRIVTLNPWDRFDRRPSWWFRAGAATVRDAGCERCLAGVAELGGGLAAAAGDAVDLLVGADVGLEGAPALAGIEGAGIRVGLGPSALVRLRAGRMLSLLGSAGWRWLPWAAPNRTWSLGAQARLHLGSRLSLALEARRAPADADASALLLGFY
jgi:hypothetical protein